MNSIKKFIQEVGVMSLSIAIAFVLVMGMAIAKGWKEPTQSPPNGNIPAPINVGDVGQIKDGPLEVNGFMNQGASTLRGNVGIGSTPSIGALYKLDVRGAGGSGAGPNNIMSVISTDGGLSEGARILLGSNDAMDAAAIAGYYPSAQNGELILYNKQNGLLTEKIRLSKDGVTIKDGDAEVRWTKTLGNYGADVYGGWSWQSLNCTYANSDPIYTALDTCDHDSVNRYGCGQNEIKNCVDVECGSLTAGPDCGADDPGNGGCRRNVTCKLEYRIENLYTDEVVGP